MSGPHDGKDREALGIVVWLTERSETINTSGFNYKSKCNDYQP